MSDSTLDAAIESPTVGSVTTLAPVSRSKRWNYVGAQVFRRSRSPPGNGLYGARDTALRRRCDAARRRTNPVAAMIRSTEEEKIKKAAALAGPLSPRTKLDGAVESSRTTDLLKIGQQRIHR
jgi:hypothetical protein